MRIPAFLLAVLLLGVFSLESTGMVFSSQAEAKPRCGECK